MPTGPSARSKVSHKKSHLHQLTAGKEYVISTARDHEGNAQIAFMAFLVKGKDPRLFFKVDELLPGVKYSVEFKANAKGESLLLTYWQRKGRKWVQLNSERFEHDQ